MKIDTDPAKNREALENIRSFSSKNILILRKGFWLFLGFIFVVASAFIYFGDPASIQGKTKAEVAITSFALGLGIILLTLLISYLFSKINEYKPIPNKGDEWLK